MKREQSSFIMIRTLCASVSLYGATLTRGLGKVKAEEPQSPSANQKFTDLREKVPFKQDLGSEMTRVELFLQVSVTSYYDHEIDKEHPWMAEPLTDEATRLEKKDLMRTKMELMIMKVPSRRSN